MNKLEYLRKWRKLHKNYSRNASRKWRKQNSEARLRDIIYSRKYREENPEWKKFDNKRNSLKIKKLVEKYKRKYPERILAGKIVRKAIKKNKLKRSRCEVCKKFPTHAHHPDYSKPLKVVWLCPKHHRRLHSKLNQLK